MEQWLMKDLFGGRKVQEEQTPGRPDPGAELCLIDGSAVIFRAFHALPRLTNSKGQHTNALTGYMSMIARLRRDQDRKTVVVVLDAGSETFRKQMYPQYKANRPPVAPELKEQLPWVLPITEALGLPVLSVHGVEADDVIATLVERAVAQRIRVTILSSDKDLMQLVGPTVQMMDPIKEKIFDVQAVKERFGVGPEKVGDLLALSGDASDNVPGVSGIGPKTAAELLNQFASFEDLYANLDKVQKPRTRKLLAEHREEALLSRKLVELKRDVPVPSFGELLARPLDRVRLRTMLADLDMKKAIRDLRLEEEGAPTQVKMGRMPPVRVVAALSDLADLCARLASSPAFAVDTETTSTDPMSASLVGLSFCTAEDSIWYVPVGHRGQGSEAQLPMEQVLLALAPLLSARGPGKLGQNFKYDKLVLKNHGTEVTGLTFDTLLAASLLEPQLESHSLDRLAREYLSWETITFKELTVRSGLEVTFDYVPVTDAAIYSGEDAWVTWRLAELLGKRMADSPMKSLYYDIELPICEVLADMEFRGIGLDAGALEQISVEFRARLQDLEKKIHFHAGQSFNINSTKQLGDLLFTKLGLPPVKKTQSGYSTDSAVLEELKHLHPVPALVLDYRTVSKLLGTYVETLPQLVNPRTGRIHTSFNQAVTATGRLSSSDPNLQNIPVQGNEGRMIRRAFIPGAGKLFLAADYSQIELRVMAHLSKDPGLTEAFRNDEDIHSRTACELFGLKREAVGQRERAIAKTINFGVLYGMSAFRLARDMGISRKDAAEFIRRYFERSPGIRTFMAQTIEAAKRDGYVETMFGRRRPISLSDKSAAGRAHAERMAINTPVQGSAADIVKKAMLVCADRLKSRDSSIQMLLQVHDELIFEVSPSGLPELAREVKDLMEGAVRLSVPLKVDTGAGTNWADIDKKGLARPNMGPLFSFSSGKN